MPAVGVFVMYDTYFLSSSKFRQSLDSGVADRAGYE